jgi:hypothetical protein
VFALISKDFHEFEEELKEEEEESFLDMSSRFTSNINFLLTLISSVSSIRKRSKGLSQNDPVLKTHSITCKLCQVQFESFGDMQRHVLTEHLQKGEIPLEK